MDVHGSVDSYNGSNRHRSKKQSKQQMRGQSRRLPNADDDEWDIEGSGMYDIAWYNPDRVLFRCPAWFIVILSMTILITASVHVWIDVDRPDSWSKQLLGHTTAPMIDDSSTSASTSSPPSDEQLTQRPPSNSPPTPTTNSDSAPDSHPSTSSAPTPMPLPTPPQPLPMCSLRRDGEDFSSYDGNWVQLQPPVPQLSPLQQTTQLPPAGPHTPDIIQGYHSKLAYRFDQCPLMMTEYSCAQFDPLRGVNLTSSYRAWQPNQCKLEDITPQEAQQCLAGRRLFFIGDSLNKIFFIDTSCRLAAGSARSAVEAGLPDPSSLNRWQIDGTHFQHTTSFMAPPPVWQGPPVSIDDAVAAQASMGKGQPGKLGKYNCPGDPWFQKRCWYAGAGVDLGDQRYRQLKTRFYYKRRYDRAWMQRQLMTPEAADGSGGWGPPHPGDVIVFSMGIFYDPDGNQMLFRRDIIDFFYLLGEMRWQGKVVMRELSPGHYSTVLQKQFDLGWTKRPATGACTRIGDEWYFRPYYHVLLRLLEACRNGESLDALRPSTKKDGLTQSAAASWSPPAPGADRGPVSHRCQNIHLLPIHEPTRLQWDAHFGSFGRKPHALDIDDCHHWCLPSAAIHTWTKTLLSFLCRKPTMSPTPPLNTPPLPE